MRALWVVCAIGLGIWQLMIAIRRSVWGFRVQLSAVHCAHPSVHRLGAVPCQKTI